MPNSKKLLAGASGYSFKEWKGSFYPSDMKPEGMLAWYAERLPTVEINNTFYQMPKTAVLENWSKSTPRVVQVLHQGVATHHAPVAAEAGLGGRLGRLPLQEPRDPRCEARPGALSSCRPFLKEGPAAPAGFPEDPARRSSCRLRIPQRNLVRRRCLRALKGAGASLCLSEREDNAPPPLVETAPWGYVRLRLESYSDADLARWAERLEATGWRDIFVYFMHEPTAPSYAQTLMQAARVG
jgi:uncharacterized protein YecE (DUF72 family)